MKRIIIISLVISLMVGVCGCVGAGGSRKELAVKYLEEKYGESFKVISYEAQSADVPYAEVVCVNGNGDKVRAFVDKAGEISDDYYGTVVKADYKKMLAETIGEYISEYKLFSNFTASYFDNEFTKDIDLESLLFENKEQFYSRSYIFIDEKAAGALDQKAFADMCSSLEKRGFSLMLAVYSVSDKEYSKIDENGDVNKYIPDDSARGPLYKSMVRAD